MSLSNMSSAMPGSCESQVSLRRAFLPSRGTLAILGWTIIAGFRETRAPRRTALCMSGWLAGSIFADRPRFLVIVAATPPPLDRRRRRTNYPRTNFPRVKPTWGHPPSTNTHILVLHTFQSAICEDQQIDDCLQHANRTVRLISKYISSVIW